MKETEVRRLLKIETVTMLIVIFLSLIICFIAMKQNLDLMEAVKENEELKEQISILIKHSEV